MTFWKDSPQWNESKQTWDDKLNTEDQIGGSKPWIMGQDNKNDKSRPRTRRYAQLITPVTLTEISKSVPNSSLCSQNNKTLHSPIKEQSGLYGCEDLYNLSFGMGDNYHWVLPLIWNQNHYCVNSGRKTFTSNISFISNIKFIYLILK